MPNPSLEKRSNYQCDNCGALLLLKRLTAPPKQGEQAFCPHCMANLPPRHGGDALQYTLVEPSLPKKRPRDANQLGKLR